MPASRDRSIIGKNEHVKITEAIEKFLEKTWKKGITKTLRENYGNATTTRQKKRKTKHSFNYLKTNIK